MVDLVFVMGEEGYSQFCTAPFSRCKEGTRVETDFSFGVVKDVISTYEGNDVYEFFKSHLHVTPIKAIVHEVTEEDFR